MVAQKTQLGQVFTPPEVAEFMVNLIIDRLEENSKILDPCIGQNIFLETIHSKNSDLRSISLDGVEIDSDLVDKKTINFFDSDHANLFLGDFFDFCTDELFDFAILNPPYIRQENIENKSGKFKILGLDRNQVSKKSNLFVYFILKSINHLKSSGRLIAIVYDSWLYSDYGSSFRNTLSDLGHVDDIYHFQQDIFPDALVGATVISFSKKKRNIPTRYFQFQKFEDFDLNFEYEEIDMTSYDFTHKSNFDENNGLFVKMKNLCSFSITRGIGTPHNPTFYDLPNRDIEGIDVIKNTKLIVGMRVEPEVLKRVLHVDDILDANTATVEYLKHAESIIEQQDNVRTLTKLIQNKKDWFRLNIKQPGNIIFNYYLRDNIRFVSNSDHYYVANNFYQMEIENHYFAQFAILNSSLTINAIKNAAKPQGNGLLKLQLNRFREVEVIDACLVTKSYRELLNKLGEKLVISHPTQIPKILLEIDEVMKLIMSDKVQHISKGE